MDVLITSALAIFQETRIVHALAVPAKVQALYHLQLFFSPSIDMIQVALSCTSTQNVSELNLVKQPEVHIT